MLRWSYGVLLWEIATLGKYYNVLALGFSELATRSSSPAEGSEPWLGHCVVFLDKAPNSQSASPSNRVYKWVPANLMLCSNHPCDGLVSYLGEEL